MCSLGRLRTVGLSLEQEFSELPGDGTTSGVGVRVRETLISLSSLIEVRF